MSTPPAPQPEEPSASGTNRSGDDDVPLEPEHSEAALRPSDLTGGPGQQQEGPAQADDDEDDDDEYEPL